MTSPLQKLEVNNDANDSMVSGDFNLPLAKETMVQSLLELTSKVLEPRLQMISWGLVLRSLQNDSIEAHSDLLNDLSKLQETIEEQNDIQLQSLMLRCMRKSKRYLDQK